MAFLQKSRGAVPGSVCLSDFCFHFWVLLPWLPNSITWTVSTSPDALGPHPEILYVYGGVEATVLLKELACPSLDS